MEIKKDSFLWKVAYFNTPSHRQPQSTNLCRFFWRFVWMFFIGVPFACLALGIFVGFVFIISFLFALYPTLLKENSGKEFAPYKKWPRIKGYLLRPIYLLLPLVLYYLRSVFLALFTLITTNIGLSIMGICMIVIGLIFGFKLLSKTEAYQLTKSYLGAKKQGVCPIITFVNVPEKTETE
ncbi:hypothetical protein IID20_01245 [Patescibacteria group bacterium]|nr:hypothetical protein [Patescibacteria group bacterium]